MEGLIGKSLSLFIHELSEWLNPRLVLPDPDAGLAIWIRSRSPLNAHVVKQDTLWPESAPIRHPQQLACFGFLAAALPGYAPELHDAWTESCQMLMNRDPFPIDRQSFAFRPIEVLGLALGFSVIAAPDSLRTWFLDVLQRCEKSGNVDLRSKLVYWLACYVSGQHSLAFPSFSTADLSSKEISIVKAIQLLAGELNVFDSNVADAIEVMLLRECSVGQVDLDNVGDVAILLFSLTHCVLKRVDGRLLETSSLTAFSDEALTTVIRICRRFPLFARQILVRRKDVKVDGQKERQARPTIRMEDEYDVQDSLHAVLRLFFDDVREEIWTPDYGGNQNRMDFLLPREQIVIEAKHMGERLTRRDIAEQLIIDERYYRNHPNCKRLVCIVFDPNLRCENAAALETDLAKKERDFEMYVIVCPTGV